MEYNDYLSLVLNSMSSKTGTVRAINSITIQDSIRMVISASKHTDSGVVYIPDYVAAGTSVLMDIQGMYRNSSVKSGNYGILVRQPCMWSGGI
jgi:hypothetical protein